MWWARLLNVISGLFAGGVAASTNSYESIATTTVGAGGVAYIEFTSIPSTYKTLEIRYIGKSTSTGTYLSGIFNGDTGINYSAHDIYGNGSVAGAEAFVSNSSIGAGSITTSSDTPFGVGIIQVIDYANTSKNKTMRILTGKDLNGSGVVLLQSGAWYNTAAVTSLRLTPSAGNIAQYSQFALYGIKG